MRMTEEQIFDKVARGEITTDEAMRLLEQQKAAGYSKIFHYNENLLKDHRIYGTQVLMGMVHCSLTVEAAAHYFSDKKLTVINNMTFLDAIKVKEGQRAEVFVDIEESGESFSFKNRYSIDSSEDFTATAAGSFSFRELPATGSALDMKSLLKQADGVVDPTSFYEGHDLYGPTFYTLKEAYYQSDGVIGYFELTPEARSEQSEYRVHPTFFDAAGVNSLFAVTPEKLGDDFWVPIFIKDIRIYSQLPEQFYCYTKISCKNSELIITNTEYYSESGELLMSLEGLNIKRVPSMAAFGIELPATVERPATPAGGDIRVEVKSYLLQKMAALLNRPVREIAGDKNFMDLGVESSSLIDLSKTIESELDVELYPTLFFEYQNINELTEYFAEEHSGSFGSTTSGSQAPPVTVDKPPVQQPPSQGPLKESVIGYLTKKVKELPGLGSASIDIKMNFMDLGIDSTSLIDMSKTIESDLDVELYPTLFFEYQNIAELAEYFIEEHSESFSSIAPKAAIKRAEPKRQVVPPVQKQRATPGVPDAAAFSQDIAVIGMAGKVAGADNMDQFWDILEASKDMISEMPENRWDYHPWFDDNRDASNKTYSKWGSFINDVDRFDPLFFGMAPKEAVWTDPQLRILLEVIYNTIEDAGYGKRIRGTNTGIYVGVCFKEYWDEVLRAHTPMNDYEHSSSSLSSLTGRVSYTFDLQGPAIPLDNACASSLTALHLACHSLRAGETDMAFVAGTNLLLSPMHHVYFSRIQALSPTGHCYSFDEKGDGYVPGEGVLAVLLKPLDKALADGDNIHAVIKGSAINHVGRSNNPTAPRPELQTKLLLKAWENAGIDPETITYLEAHGTGTPLGDPIEVNALKKAFKKHTTREGFCHLGSTKAHLGHLEAAAGLAGIMKVIMSMKKGKIPKMPNYEKTNPYLKLDGSPLKINRDLTEWPVQPGVPRRAGISSFGMTGNNSHVVVEEYIAPQSGSVLSGQDELFILSARDESRLKEYAQRFIDFLTDKKAEVNFADMIYSLQLGREEMGQRLAIVAKGHDDLLSALKSYVNGSSDNKNIIAGHIKDSDSAITESLITGEEGEEFIKVIIKNRNVAKVAYLWIMGVKIDWTLLHRSRGVLLSLPTYPFERKRYWKPERSYIQAAESSLSDGLLGQIAHNLSMQSGLVFENKLFESSPLLDDHRINGKALLPGVAYIEMALEAAQRLEPGTSYRVTDMLWLSPLAVTGRREIRVKIKRANSAYQFEIESGIDEQIIHSTGKLVKESGNRPLKRVDIEKEKSGLDKVVTAEELKSYFAERGVDYGDYYNRLERVLTSPKTALSRLKLSKEESDQSANYIVHPALLDGAVQTAAALLIQQSSKNSLFMPFSIESVTLLKKAGIDCYVTVTERSQYNYTITITDSAGNRAIEIEGLAFREVKEGVTGVDKANIFYTPQWKLHITEKESNEMSDSKAILIYPPEAIELKTAIAKLHHPENIEELLLTNSSRKVRDGLWELDLYSKESMENYLDSVTDIETIYFMGGLEKKETELDKSELFEMQQQKGLFTLLRLVKALSKKGYSDKKLTVKVVTNELYNITGKEELKPFSSPLAGLTKSIAREFDKWQVGSFDLKVDESTDSLSLAARRVVFEEESLLALRDEALYKPVIYKSPLPEVNKNRRIFKEDGVYLITGGMGGIGYKLCTFLAEEVKAKLIIIGRSPMDQKKHKRLDELRDLGADPLYLQADMTDYASMRKALNEGKKRFGLINGVVHSAAVVNDNLIVNLDEAALKEALAPALEGSLTLYETVKDERLDFMLLFSSGASFYCDLGTAGYVAGNSFKDSLAYYLNEKSEFPVKVINWGYWSGIGLGSIEGLEERFRAQGIEPLDPEKSIEAIERVLAAPKCQTLVIKARADYLKKMNLQRGRELNFLPGSSPSVIDKSKERVKTDSARVTPYRDAYFELNRFGSALLLFAFQEMGFLREAKRGYNIEGLFEQARIITKYKRLYMALLNNLERAGYIKEETATTFITTEKVGEPKDDLGVESRKKRFPQIAPLFELLYICVSRFPEILTGQLPATDIMFPDGSARLVENVYKNNPLSDYINELVVETVYILVKGLLNSSAKKIKILEIGAGTGGTSAIVLNRLQEFSTQIEYTYTDISTRFLQYGREHYGTLYPFVEFKLLNIEDNPLKQDYKAGDYDLIIGANVIHATQELDKTLTNSKALLKKGGCLLLNEATGLLDFLTLTFGTMEGWWLYKDEDLRLKHAPLLSSTKWDNFLKAKGFGKVSAKGIETEWWQQHVIIAESDGAIIKEATEVKAHQRPITKVKKLSRQKVSTDLKSKVLVTIASILEVDEKALDEDLAFSDFGVDSIISVKIVNTLNSDLGLELKTTDLFNYSTIKLLYNHISQMPQVASPEAAPKVKKVTSGTAAISTNIKEEITTIVANTVGIEESDIDSSLPFTDLGVDSILSVKIVNSLNSALSLELKTTDLFNYTTIEALSTHCESLAPAQSSTKETYDDEYDEEEEEEEGFDEQELDDKKMMKLLKELEEGNLGIEEIENMLGEGDE